MVFTTNPAAVTQNTLKGLKHQLLFAEAERDLCKATTKFTFNQAVKALSLTCIITVMDLQITSATLRVA